MEVHVSAQVKNGKLYRAVQVCGTQSALAKYLEVRPVTIGLWLKFRAIPAFHLKSNQERLDRLDKKFIALIGYGLDEIFPDEIRNSKTDLAAAAKFEAFLDMPVERLIAAGVSPQLPPAPDEVVTTRERGEILHEVLGTLTPRQQMILKKRFGIGCPPETLDEVATQLGVTRARVQQIERHALRCLRTPARSRRLKEFYV